MLSPPLREVTACVLLDRYPSFGRMYLSEDMVPTFNPNVNLHLAIYRCSKHLKFHKIYVSLILIISHLIWFLICWQPQLFQQTKLALQKQPTIYYRNRLHTNKVKLFKDKAQSWGRYWALTFGKPGWQSCQLCSPTSLTPRNFQGTHFC
jgi:hypothetical protein